MIEILDVEDAPVTKREVKAALMTVRRYCTEQGACCNDCEIQDFCEKYVNDNIPADWRDI